MSTSWADGPLISFDTETTGTDVEQDRIVTGALVLPDGTTREWLAAVDVDIPAGATEVHGITTEHARTHGTPPAIVLEEMCELIARQLVDGAALVIMNAPFDLTILDRECGRHGVLTMQQRLGCPVSPVIDPLIIDRTADKYRKGKRDLTALCRFYGVPLTDAHTADADARAALGVALALADRYPLLRDTPADVLHRQQIGCYARWAAGLEQYRRRTDPTAAVDQQWPVRRIEVSR